MVSVRPLLGHAQRCQRCWSPWQRTCAAQGVGITAAAPDHIPPDAPALFGLLPAMRGCLWCTSVSAQVVAHHHAAAAATAECAIPWQER